MGENSKISWTNHTFNGLRGCSKISSGCDNCYAETMSHRNPKLLGVWGEEGTRVLASENMWREPLRWNAEAEKAQRRARVFSYSLGDVFERPRKPENMAVCDAARMRLFALIDKTPWLDWLLLTKRANEIMRMVPAHWRVGFPANVWMGCSVENQDAADARVPYLLRVPARVRWLSCEPMLGPIDLWTIKDGSWHDREGADRYNALTGSAWWSNGEHGLGGGPALQWVVCGGESGSNRRTLDIAWAESLHDQCDDAGVPFFMKQDSAFASGAQGRLPDALWNTKQFPA